MDGATSLLRRIINPTKILNLLKDRNRQIFYRVPLQKRARRQGVCFEGNRNSQALKRGSLANCVLLLQPSHESAIMRVVSHPLLLEFKETVQTKNHVYIVTELVRGKDLFDFVRDFQYL